MNNELSTDESRELRALESLTDPGGQWVYRTYNKAALNSLLAQGLAEKHPTLRDRYRITPAGKSIVKTLPVR